MQSHSSSDTHGNGSNVQSSAFFPSCIVHDHMHSRLPIVQKLCSSLNYPPHMSAIALLAKVQLAVKAISTELVDWRLRFSTCGWIYVALTDAREGAQNSGANPANRRSINRWSGPGTVKWSARSYACRASALLPNRRSRSARAAWAR
jgi:hypothetical protein